MSQTFRMCKDDEHDWSGAADEDGRKRCLRCDTPSLTPLELASAIRFRAWFTPVSLDETEKLPDPDYGL